MWLNFSDDTILELYWQEYCLHLVMGTVSSEEMCNLLKLNNACELQLISKSVGCIVCGQTF